MQTDTHQSATSASALPAKLRSRRWLLTAGAAASAAGAAAIVGGAGSAEAASDVFTAVAPVNLLNQAAAVAANAVTVVNTGQAGATAVMVQISMQDVVQAGYITAWSGSGTRPNVWTGSWRSSKQDSTVCTTVPVVAGKFSIFASNGVRLRVDLIGVFGPAPAVVPTTSTAPVTTVAATTTLAPTTTALAPTTTAAPTTTLAPTTTTTAPVVDGINGRPFAANSPWNTPITGAHTWYDHDLLHNIPGGINGDFRRHYYVNENSLTIWRATASDPLVTFNLPAFIDPVFNRNRPASTFTFRCPANAVPANDDDKMFVVLDTVTGEYVEVWLAVRNGNTITGTGWARGNVNTGTGMGGLVAQGGNNAGERAANFSWIGGAITGRDIAAGKFDHALVLAFGYGMLSNTLYRSPATAPDNGQHDGPFAIGTQLAIPPNGTLLTIDGTSKAVAKPTGLSTLGNMMWDALQTYGAYIGDFAGSPYPMFFIDTNTVANGATHQLFTWWDSWTADMDVIGKYVRVLDYQP